MRRGQGDLWRHHQRVAAGRGGAPGGRRAPGAARGDLPRRERPGRRRDDRGGSRRACCATRASGRRSQPTCWRCCRRATMASRSFAPAPPSGSGPAWRLGASAEQALAAARAGAACRDRAGRAVLGGVDGYDMVRKLVALFKTYDVATKVIAAAIRIPTEIIDAALVGAHVATAPVRRAAPARRRRARGAPTGGCRSRCESASTSTR